ARHLRHIVCFSSVFSLYLPCEASNFKRAVQCRCRSLDARKKGLFGRESAARSRLASDCGAVKIRHVSKPVRASSPKAAEGETSRRGGYNRTAHGKATRDGHEHGRADGVV